MRVKNTLYGCVCVCVCVCVETYVVVLGEMGDVRQVAKGGTNPTGCVEASESHSCGALC